jgi:hypothetical protein
MVAIALGIGIPIVNEQVRMAEVRGAADELALNLRAARMISVTQHRSIAFTVKVDPDNRYWYERYAHELPRTFSMPGRVRIAPASDRMINFRDNGSVDIAAEIIIESDVSGACERWTATVSTVGLTTLAHERVH